jgi:D-apionolactonase
MSSHRSSGLSAASLRALGLPAPSSGAAALRIQVGAAPFVDIPAIGFALGEVVELPATTTVDRIRSLRPAHLRLDVRLASIGWEERLRRQTEVAVALGAPLELALHDVAADDAFSVVAALSSIPDALAVRRVIVIGDDVWLARPPVQELVRSHTRRLRPQAEILAGARTNFDILNRHWDAVDDVDGVAFGMQPQWHASDDLSVIETLEGQAHAAASARAAMPDATVAVSPLSLGPDYDGEIADPRHRSLFAAAWTLGSVAALAEARVDAVTYYQLLGPVGLISTDRRTAEEGPVPGPVHPCYHVFADLNSPELGAISGVVLEGDYPATGVAVGRDGLRAILVGSFSPVPASVEVWGLDDGPWESKVLDGGSARGALFRPEVFRASSKPVTVRDGQVVVPIGPYGLLSLARPIVSS